MHSNVTIKNVSWPHFSWATMYMVNKVTRNRYSFYWITLCVDKSCDDAVSTGRTLDQSCVVDGSANGARAGVWVGAEASRGSLGAVYQSMRVSV